MRGPQLGRRDGRDVDYLLSSGACAGLFVSFTPALVVLVLAVAMAVLGGVSRSLNQVTLLCLRRSIEWCWCRSKRFDGLAAQRRNRSCPAVTVSCLFTSNTDAGALTDTSICNGKRMARVGY